MCDIFLGVLIILIIAFEESHEQHLKEFHLKIGFQFDILSNLQILGDFFSLLIVEERDNLDFVDDIARLRQFL